MSILKRQMVRIEEKLKIKLEYMAFKSGRSVNKELRQILLQYIEQYEKRYGQITFDYHCSYLDRPVVADYGYCFLRTKCKVDDCQQRGGANTYMLKTK